MKKVSSVSQLIEVTPSDFATGSSLYMKTSAGIWKPANSQALFRGRDDLTAERKGLFLPGPMYNIIENSLMVGANPGTGALPTGWTVTPFPQLTVTTGAVGVLADGMNYIDLNISITAAYTGGAAIFMTPNMGILASNFPLSGSNYMGSSAINYCVLSQSNISSATFFCGTMATGAFAQNSLNSTTATSIALDLTPATDPVLAKVAKNNLAYNATLPYMAACIRLLKTVTTSAASMVLRLAWAGSDFSGFRRYSRPGSIDTWGHVVAGSGNNRRVSKNIKPTLPFTPNAGSGSRRKFSVILEFENVNTYLASQTPTRAEFLHLVKGGVFGTGTPVVRVTQEYLTVTGKTHLWLWAEQATQRSVSIGAIASNGLITKLALSMDENVVRACMNGGSVVGFSDGTLTGVTADDISDMGIIGDEMYLRRCQILYERLSDTDLQALTTM